MTDYLIAAALVALALFVAHVFRVWWIGRKAFLESQSRAEHLRQIRRVDPQIREPKQKYAGIPERHRLS